MINFRDDNYFMQQALREAQSAREDEEVPVGAVIVYKENTQVTSWQVADGVNEFEYIDTSVGTAVSSGDRLSVVITDNDSSPQPLTNVIILLKIEE